MKKLKTCIMLLLFFIFNCGFASVLKPFETDNCTLFLDGPITKPQLWKHCCVEHDLRYWFGGSVTDMDNADLRLMTCVQKVAGEKWGQLIYSGVRAGHASPIKNKYHWGWAWSGPRKSTPLNTDEINYIINQLKSMSVDGVDIENFIKINFPNQKAL